LKEVKPSDFTLFEGFGPEFGDLKSFAILIPAGHLTKADHCIQYLNAYYSEELSQQSHSFEARLNALLDVKPKWTYGELETYLSEWVEPDCKLAVLLSRMARVVREDNPFSSQKTQFYVKKF
jgi:hypothetical protein